MEPRLFDIVTVNWNAGTQIADCVRSVEAHGTGLVARCIVVDNGSTDGSLDLLDENSAIVIRNNNNLGFGVACNIGAMLGNAPFIVFLNPDAMCAPDALPTIARFMTSAEGMHVAVCGIRLIGEDGNTQAHCSRFPSVRTFIGMSLGLTDLLPRIFPPLVREDWPHDRSGDVDHVIGAFYVMRRTVFETIGGFDPRFFVYYDDLDLSNEVRRRGWRIHYLAEATSFHRGGGVSDQVKAHRLAYGIRSRILYAFKYFPYWQAGIVAAAALLLEPLARTARAVAHRSWSELRDTWRGFGMIYVGFPKTISEVRRAGRITRPPLSPDQKVER